jgi:hypothetical protein
MNGVLFFSLVTGVSLAVTFIVAYIQYKKNEQEMIKIQIEELLDKWKHDRIRKWRRKAIECEEERKKPVRVQFD